MTPPAPLTQQCSSPICLLKHYASGPLTGGEHWPDRVHRHGKPSRAAAQVLYSRVLSILMSPLEEWWRWELGAKHIPWTVLGPHCQAGDSGWSLWLICLLCFHHHLCSFLHPAHLS